MAYKIDENKCVGCGSCAANCPVQAISQTKDGKYQIDPNKCIGCGLCASVCPVEAPKAN